MAMLEGIFDAGHTLACTRAPVKHVMLVEEAEDRPAGHYFVSEEEIEIASVAQVVSFRNLGRRVRLKDLLTWASLTWYPAVDNCWCDPCKGARQLRSTPSS